MKGERKKGGRKDGEQRERERRILFWYVEGQDSGRIMKRKRKRDRLIIAAFTLNSLINEAGKGSKLWDKSQLLTETLSQQWKYNSKLKEGLEDG